MKQAKSKLLETSKGLLGELGCLLWLGLLIFSLVDWWVPVALALRSIVGERKV